MCSYQNKRITKTAGLFGLVISATLFIASNAAASAFDSNISISATAEMDPSSVPADPGITSSGTFSSVIAGVSDSATVDGALTVSGTLPQGGVLTDILDGVGMGFLGSGGFVGTDVHATELYGNYNVDMANNSLVDTFKITLGWEFFNQVDADGTDAFVFGQLSLFDSAEFFFSDLRSDSFLGDEAFGSDDTPDTNWETNAGSLGTKGSSLVDQGLLLFDFILAPGDMINLTGFHDMRAGAIDGSFTADISSRFYVSEVLNLTNTPEPTVPEPASLWLIAAGLAAFRFSRRLG